MLKKNCLISSNREGGELMAFCKLYEREGFQVLVKIDQTPEGFPEVRFYFEPKDLGVCSWAVTAKNDSTESWTRLERIFDDTTEEIAFEEVTKIMNKLPGLHP